MRTIKFRGMDVNGSWYYGNLSIVTDKRSGAPSAGSYISNSVGCPFAYQVRPETVGQLTGNTDKFGKNDIYEGDIIEIEYYPDLPTTRDLDELVVRTVCRYGTDCSFHLRGIGKAERVTYSVNFGGSAIKRKEVIGNIHSNPELLEVKV